MSKRKAAKYKLDRRMGENVFGRPKSPVNKRECRTQTEWDRIAAETHRKAQSNMGR